MVQRPQHVLTGTRIRERRIALARRQADVARAAGISAAYLNLIEHNRRPVGAALIARLARALEVPAAELEAGREEARIAALREAAARLPAAEAELGQAAEFAARFPGWAGLTLATARQAEGLERRLVTLSQRMSQDPYLPATLHEVLSAVTSLRATAAILSEGGDLPADLARRFHANIDQDSQRLTLTARALVAYLDSFEDDGALLTPQEEVEAWFAAGAPPLDAAEDLVSDASRQMAAALAARLASDAATLPDAVLDLALAASTDPLAIAHLVRQPLDLVMRRLVVRRPPAFAQAGLILCDGAGALVLRLPPPGFPLARQGEGCALLPLYRALAQPQTALAATVETPEGVRFETLSFAVRSQPLGAAGPLLTQGQMLILPGGAPGAANTPAIGIGPTCPICPRDACPARREPSILPAR